MEAFRCLAQDCEDNCCKRWSVRLDREHYQRILDLGTTIPTLQATINSSVHITPSPVDKDHYATIEMNQQGYCPFLNQDALCQLQDLGGINVLGNTCANYPRVYYQIDNTVEMIGALSCPEVTRLCFRSTDKSQLIPIKPETLPRKNYRLTLHIDTQKSNYYERQFPLVRDEFMRIALHPDYTSKQILYLLCYLSQRLSMHYNNDCNDSIESVFQHELKRFSGPDIINSLLAHMDNFQDLSRIGLITVQSIFSIRIQHYKQDPLTPYINDIIESYRDHMPFEMDIDTLARIYFKRKKTILDSVHAQLENYLSRHLQNCILREWFIRFPDPYHYIQMLTLRQAMLRFLLYSHPSIQQWCKADANHTEETLHSVIEEISVEIFYLFSRSIEHDITFLQNVYSALTTEDMMNLDASLAFIKGL
ncbi:MAG: flagellin lysine-N-methylase [Gammaproteobacteria bacterium]|nr:flagellin lysine-N-methylase [Gammaproteobacteria bacterium]